MKKYYTIEARLCFEKFGIWHPLWGTYNSKKAAAKKVKEYKTRPEGCLGKNDKYRIKEYIAWPPPHVVWSEK